MASAMILAAGLGTRLRPLTDELPKPLLWLGDRPLIAHIAEQLAAGGVRRAALNKSHLAERFSRDLIAAFPVPVDVLHEPEPFGTAGGLANAAGALGDGDVILWNGDILIDLDVAALCAAHGQRGAAATLAVAPRPAGEGTVGVGAQGEVVRLRGERFGEEVAGGDFVGVHVVGEALRRRLPPRGCMVGDVYLPWLREGRAIYRDVRGARRVARHRHGRRVPRGERALARAARPAEPRRPGRVRRRGRGRDRQRRGRGRAGRGGRGAARVRCVAGGAGGRRRARRARRGDDAGARRARGRLIAPPGPNGEARRGAQRCRRHGRPHWSDAAQRMNIWSTGTLGMGRPSLHVAAKRPKKGTVHRYALDVLHAPATCVPAVALAPVRARRRRMRGRTIAVGSPAAVAALDADADASWRAEQRRQRR
ncbi:sugar phosphate nucleotidyltransferase [Sorangium sp. So ce119]|uniref:nucleotidyltransferase family protein n=1 Tax=Sorangium sp. So ce119 TaxID=3133279 RepID=UPI003F628A72